MGKENELFALVHAMRGNEKRYFKLLARQNSKNNHHNLLELFELINGMEEYDSAIILQKCKGRTTVNDLAAARYQLTQLILKSLRGFYAEKTNASYFRHRLEDIGNLFQKDLLQQCQKLIQKVRKKAELLENQYILLELAEWESKLLLQNPPRDLEAVLLERGAYKRNIIRQKLAEEELNVMFREVFVYSKIRFAALNVKQRSRLAAILGHALVRNGQDLPTAWARLLRHLILGIYAAMNVLYLDCEGHCLAAMKILKARADLTAEQPEMYRIVIANLLNSCLFLHKMEEFLDFLAQASTMQFRRPIDQRRLQQLIYSQELMYCLNYGDQDRGKSLVLEIRHWMEGKMAELEPSTIFHFLYNSTIFHFLHGNFSNSLFHLNRILNLRRSDVRRDLQNFAHLFQAVVHFEMDHFDLVEYQVRNAFRYFKLEKGGVTYEVRVLNYLQKLLKVADPAQALPIYKALNRDLATFLSERGTRRPPGVQELKFWVESKLAEENIGEYFRKMLATKG
ncbi:MAG TPA: hypothetical protein ENJ82_04965 [Bacteroidetes bacterium]|nr:hypothetical protein [Bacteroidota bacterium]